GPDGGFIEISGKINLAYDGNADLSAPQGQAGTLLFDPKNIFIGATGTHDGELPNIFKDTDPGVDYFISATALNALTGTVILEATEGIEIQEALNLLSSNITFRADTIVANASITGETITFDGLSTVSLQAPVTATNLNLKAHGVIVSNIVSNEIQTTNLSIIANGSWIAAPVKGSGTLTLDTFSPDQSVVIGGTVNTPAWDLYDHELNRFSGFGTTVIGKPGNTGSLSFVDNPTVRNFVRNTNLTVNGMGSLQGFNQDATWTLTGTGQGRMNNGDVAFNFNNVGRLTGGSGRDTFVFNPRVDFGGILDGGTGLGTLDYSNYQRPAQVNLAQNQATGTLAVFNIDSYIAAPHQGNVVSPPQQISPVLPPAIKDAVTVTPPPELNELHSNPTAHPNHGNQDQERALGVGDRHGVERLLDGLDLEGAIAALDEFFAGELLNYLGKRHSGRTLNVAEMQDILKTGSAETGLESALIYIFLRPEHIDLILIPPEAAPIHYTVPVAKTEVLAMVQRLRQEIGDPVRRMTVSYLPPAQQLHQWLIAPMQADLDRFGIEALLFSVDSGLHTLPMAALHSGQGFLMENYNLSMVPSLSLTQTQRTNLNQASMFAMGVADFVVQPDLPAVPMELKAIAATQTQTQTLLNDKVTWDNWRTHQGRGVDIVHIATHAEFRPGAPDQSYIQLWDEQISMADLQSIPWREQGVNLLVLSACRTAFGSPEAEFGFAGIAVSTGVQSAVASIWPANDVATLALMKGFYQHLTTAPTKAEALRRAQLDLLNRGITLDGGQLVGSGMAIDLPSELQKLGDRPFHHPYYWSGFALIGSPW
ncbi:MAG: CHAT domain-containing protein, partial [Spirulina sp. DLM2.Bin59]